MANDWSEYLSRISGGDSGSAIARKVGTTPSKVSYWRSGSRLPSVAEAIHVSRVYDRPPLEGLVKAGYLEADDVDGALVAPPPLTTYTDAELADELLRRTTGRSGDVDK